jgi:hypothetical protein
MRDSSEMHSFLGFIEGKKGLKKASDWKNKGAEAQARLNI